MDVLRFATAGSVDDGKSTLIGRLLYDAKALFDDQVESVTYRDGIDLARLTDGLRAEREQGITIDVAYRYFATPKRKFVIADTPGHVQYTRNMVTGASTADAALVLVDARKGLVEQSRRHAYLAALLRVRHLVLAVNKMDLVGFEQSVYERIAADFRAFAARLDVTDVEAIPVSALEGDNVVDRSARMPWYDGPSLLDHLEALDLSHDQTMEEARFPVQYVIRHGDADYRGYAGTLAAGVLRVGDEVTVLPSGRTTTVAAIDTYDGPVEVAVPPMAVTVRLADEIDVSRGDMLVTGSPTVTQDLEATVCWMAEEPLRPGTRIGVKHTTRTTKAVVRSLGGTLDVTTLAHAPAETLALNDIGRVTLRTMAPLFLDSYADSRATGSFILVDELTGATVGAGMTS